MTPIAKPPTTAPIGLSRPPSTAAAKAKMRMGISVPVVRPESCATKTPATAPTAADSPHPMDSICPTGMPTSRLAVRFWAVARMARPSRVRWNRRNMSTIMMTATTRMPTLSWPMQTSPAHSGAPLKTEKGPNPLGRAPHLHKAKLLNTVNSPSVTITALRTGASSTRRRMSRSRMAPSAAATSSARKNAGQKSILVMKLQAMNVVNIAISPWAKLSTLVER